MAVSKDVAGGSLGRQLVDIIKRQAARAGIVSLYGVCYPSVAGFWRKQGFAVSEAAHAGANVDQPVRMIDGSVKTLDMTGESGNHMFVRSFGAAGDGAARLSIP